MTQRCIIDFKFTMTNIITVTKRYILLSRSIYYFQICLSLLSVQDSIGLNLNSFLDERSEYSKQFTPSSLFVGRITQERFSLLFLLAHEPVLWFLGQVR